MSNVTVNRNLILLFTLPPLSCSSFNSTTPLAEGVAVCYVDAACGVSTFDDSAGMKYDACSNARFLTASVDAPVRLEADQSLLPGMYHFYTGQAITVRWTASSQLYGGVQGNNSVRISYRTNSGTQWITKPTAPRTCVNTGNNAISTQCAYATGGTTPGSTPYLSAQDGVYTTLLAEFVSSGGGGSCWPCPSSPIPGVPLIIYHALDLSINFTIAPIVVLVSRVTNVAVDWAGAPVSAINVPAAGTTNLTVRARLLGNARYGKATITITASGGLTFGSPVEVDLPGPTPGNLTASIAMPATLAASSNYRVTVSVSGGPSGLPYAGVNSPNFQINLYPSYSNTPTPSTTLTGSTTQSASHTPSPTSTGSVPIDVASLLAKAKSDASTGSLAVVIGVVVGVIAMTGGSIVGYRLYQRKQQEAKRKRKQVASGGQNKADDAALLYLGHKPEQAPSKAAREDTPKAAGRPAVKKAYSQRRSASAGDQW